MNRRITAAAALAGAVLILTSCTGAPTPQSTASDEEKAQQAAVAFHQADNVTRCDMQAGQSEPERKKCKSVYAADPNSAPAYDPAQFTAEPHSIETDRWRNGYGVMLAFTPKNGSEQFAAYGVVPDGDQWKIAKWNTVTDSEKNQPNALCQVLADDAGEC